MKKLIAIHNQYIQGMMSFAVFAFAFSEAMSKTTCEEFEQFRNIKDHYTHAEMIKWEREHDVLPVFPSNAK